jgi:hypothetical protein
MKIYCVADWYVEYQRLHEECYALYQMHDDHGYTSVMTYPPYLNLLKIVEEMKQHPLGFKQANEMIEALEKELVYERLKLSANN